MPISRSILDQLDSQESWKWNSDPWRCNSRTKESRLERIEKIRKFVEDNGFYPRHTDSSLYQFMITLRNDFIHKRLDACYIEMLERIPEWSWSGRFGDRLVLLDFQKI